MTISKTELDRLTKDAQMEYRTHGGFTFLGNYKNLNTMSEEEVHQAAYLLESAAIAHRSLPASLGLTDKFLFSGFAYHEWISDFRKRIAIIRLARENVK